MLSRKMAAELDKWLTTPPEDPECPECGGTIVWEDGQCECEECDWGVDDFDDRDWYED